MYQKVSCQKKGDYYMQKKKVFKTPHLLQYFLCFWYTLDLLC